MKCPNCGKALKVKYDKNMIGLICKYCEYMSVMSEIEVIKE